MKLSPHRRRKSGLQDERGTALIIAVTMLFLFVLLGSAYVKFGFLEIDETNLELREARARALAEGGVNAALGRIHDALSQQEATTAFGSASLSFPIYMSDKHPESPGLALMDEAGGQVEVTITDESGKVNLNHAPASVLQRVLGIDGTTARNITASLPRADGAATEEGKQWLLGLEDLLSRKLLTQEQYDTIDASLVTTDTVLNHQQPGAYLSINTAPAEVLAAVLDVPVEQAQQVKAKGPFNSIEALADAAGITPADIAGAAAASTEQSPFLMQPNCFRLRSSASYLSPAGQRATAQVEAVVLFDEQNNYHIVRWRTQDSQIVEAEETVVAEASAEPAEAEGAPEQEVTADEAAPAQPVVPEEAAAEAGGAEAS